MQGSYQNHVHWFTSDFLSVMSDTAKIYVKVVEATNIAADVRERVGKEYIRWDSIAIFHLLFQRDSITKNCFTHIVEGTYFAKHYSWDLNFI